MTAHFCTIHNCKFYENKKGDRTWWSHKIKGGDGYCNEPKDEMQGKEEIKEIFEESVRPAPEITPKHTSSPETGMWWGQLGEMIRHGNIDKSTPQGVTAIKAYYAEMFCVLGINVKEVQPVTNRLVEAAKKMGAQAISEEDK